MIFIRPAVAAAAAAAAAISRPARVVLVVIGDISTRTFLPELRLTLFSKVKVSWCAPQRLHMSDISP